MKTFEIILTNCDCASDVMAVPKGRSGKWMYGPRCPGCHRVLGPMQWKSAGEVQAADALDAAAVHIRVRKEQYHAKIRGDKYGG